MAITGSGGYIAIAASSTVIDGIVNYAGLVFGKDGVPYCRIASRYVAENGVITGTALTLDPYADRPISLDFPNLTLLKVNGYTGFTGTMNACATWTDESTRFTMKAYEFQCGLLLNTYIDPEYFNW